jgi:hypothetical protein
MATAAPPTVSPYQLGDVGSSEALIRELYIDLRRRINAWAAITKQTAQARMGYVGQHLVSIATGHPGGRSGARGKDLVISDTEYGEIKTCYRVDQLGACQDCGSVVASIEFECSGCGSANIIRKDDSKWLISIRTADEYDRILEPKHYYLVLFEFVDIWKPDTIRASIWRVNPFSPGFAYAMLDYYGNIKANSVSGAPFNLWPYSLKFELMRPCLIYRSYIKSDDTIATEIFPGRDAPHEDTMIDLAEFSRARNLTPTKINVAAARMGLAALPIGAKKTMIESLMHRVQDSGIPAGVLADALAYCLYRPDIDKFFPTLPGLLRRHLDEAGLLA